MIWDWLVPLAAGLCAGAMAGAVAHAVVTRTYDLLFLTSSLVVCTCFILIMAMVTQEQAALARLAVQP